MISLGFCSSSTTAFWVIWTVNMEEERTKMAITPPIIREFCFILIIYYLQVSSHREGELAKPRYLCYP
mgnify:CR=1 FL=1